MGLNPEFLAKPDMEWRVQDPEDIVSYSRNVVFGSSPEERVLQIGVNVIHTNVTGVLNDVLRIAIPGTWVGTGQGSLTGTLIQNGVGHQLTIDIPNGANNVRIKKSDGTNFEAATDTKVVFGGNLPVRAP